MANIPIVSQLENYLSLTNQRATVIASNMANVDTPGYRTVGFDFAAEMSRSVQQLSTGSGDGQATSIGPVDGLLERPDGNNVSMDREGLNMAEAQLQFRTGVELLRHEFTRVLDAIHEDQK